MSYSYFDKDNNIKKLDIQVGMNWNDVKTDNDKLNSVFAEVDDGDGIVQFTEKLMVDGLLKQANKQTGIGTSGNDTLENDEIEMFDLKSAKLLQSFSIEDFSLENIEKNLPKDKYTISKTKTGATITEKSSGKVIITINNNDNGTTSIYENTNTNKQYNIYEYKGNTDIGLRNSENIVEKTYGFKDGKVTHAIDNDYYLNTVDKVDKEIATRRKNDPNWISKYAMSYIDSLPDNELMGFIEQYHDENDAKTPVQIDKNGNYERDNNYLLDTIARCDAIPEDVRNEFIQRTQKRLEAVVGYKDNLTIKGSHVKTEFYESKHTYDVEFKNDKVTVTMNPKEGTDEEPVTRTIDLNKLLSKVQPDLKPAIKASIQKLPGEILMLLSVECDYFNPVDREPGIDGKFSSTTDRITVGYGGPREVSPSTITHELGHALDAGALSQRKEQKIMRFGRHSYVTGVDIERKVDRNPEFTRAYTYAKFKFMGLEKYVKNPQKKNQTLDYKALEKDGYMDDMGMWTPKFQQIEEKAYMLKSGEGPSMMMEFIIYGSSKLTDKSAVTDELRDAFVKLYEEIITQPPEDRHDKQN